MPHLIESTLRALPIILADVWGEYVGLRREQRDALAALVEAARTEGWRPDLVAACDEASDEIVGRPNPHDVAAAALAVSPRVTDQRGHESREAERRYETHLESLKDHGP